MKRRIMRRVYYSYAIALAVHSMLWRGVFLGAAAVLLADWLHVASIFNNFLSVPVGSVPQYIGGAFIHAATHGEAITVFLVLAAGAIAATCVYQFSKHLRIDGPTLGAA